MELGTRLRYGMLAMLALARRRARDGPVRAEDIAKTEGLSKGYLEGLLATLRRAGLVRAVRGPGGGWMLAKPASRVRPIDVYAALEGTTALVPCVENRRICPLSVDKAKNCRARSIWVAMTRALQKTLRARTLAALAGVPHKSTRKATKKKSSVAKKKTGPPLPRLRRAASAEAPQGRRRTRGAKAKARPKAKAKKSADATLRSSPLRSTSKRKAAVVRNREIVKVLKQARLRRSA